jgi:hypothetical protein
MIKKLKKMLFKYQIAKLEKVLVNKMTAAVELQRNGKIKEYAEASKEISDLQDELDGLRIP